MNKSKEGVTLGKSISRWWRTFTLSFIDYIKWKFHFNPFKWIASPSPVISDWNYGLKKSSSHNFHCRSSPASHALSIFMHTERLSIFIMKSPLLQPHNYYTVNGAQDRIIIIFSLLYLVKTILGDLSLLPVLHSHWSRFTKAHSQSLYRVHFFHISFFLIINVQQTIFSQSISFITRERRKRSSKSFLFPLSWIISFMRLLLFAFHL